MSVAVTSLDAYRKLQETGKELSQMARVALCIESHPGCTRLQISRQLKLNEARVAARVNRLVKDGMVREDGTVRDYMTHAMSKRLWTAHGVNLRLPL